MDYISAKEAARRWGITQRRVEALAVSGRIGGVERIGSMWLIPKSAEKPLDGRTKAMKNRKGLSRNKINLEAEQVIRMVNGTMCIEGMPLTDEDKDRLRAVYTGTITADDLVQQLIVKHGRQ